MYTQNTMDMVAPFMGAWIEIYEIIRKYTDPIVSHPLWVRGLKSTSGMEKLKNDSRTLYGCVD